MPVTAVQARLETLDGPTQDRIASQAVRHTRAIMAGHARQVVRDYAPDRAAMRTMTGVMDEYAPVFAAYTATLLWEQVALCVDRQAGAPVQPPSGPARDLARRRSMMHGLIAGMLMNAMWGDPDAARAEHQLLETLMPVEQGEGLPRVHGDDVAGFLDTLVTLAARDLPGRGMRKVD